MEPESVSVPVLFGLLAVGTSGASFIGLRPRLVAFFTRVAD